MFENYRKPDDQPDLFPVDALIERLAAEWRQESARRIAEARAALDARFDAVLFFHHRSIGQHRRRIRERQQGVKP